MRDSHISLNASQAHHLLITCKHIDKLLGDIEATLNAAASKTVFPNYVGDITPLQCKTIEDYIDRIRGQLLQVLAGQSLTPGSPRISAAHSVNVNLTFIEIAIAQLAPNYMKGYGPVSEQGTADLNGIMAELQSAVTELLRYVVKPRTGDLQERVERLAKQGWDVGGLQTLAEIIDHHGLIEFRPTIGMLLDRAEDTALEIALFGRVSTGKSSLLNHVIGADLLPVGVMPITAVPTRIGYGHKPSVRVWQEGRGISEHKIDEISSFVDERLNPENQKRVGRILVLYPSERLREGIIFVDTPGLGSLATRGAAETMAYLPRCDTGIVLVDAGSTLTPDDLKIIDALTQASTKTAVLVSKADLLSQQDLEQQITYVRRQLATELSMELSVRPVSVMPSHAALLEEWFRAELMPLYERKQRILQESLTRKTLAFAATVQSVLEAAGTHALLGGDDRRKLEEIDLELRHSAGNLEKFQADLRRTTEDVPRLASFILNKTAEAIADIWRTEREVDGAETLRATAAEVAVEVAGEVRAQLLKMDDLFQHALSKAASLLAATDVAGEDDLRILTEMPVFHINRQDNFATRPLWASLGRRFLVTAAKQRLHPYERSLTEALESFSRLLYSWGTDAGSDLERRFDGLANRYRAQLERLLLDRTRTTIDSERVKSDFSKLAKMFAGDLWADGKEAIAS